MKVLLILVLLTIFSTASGCTDKTNELRQRYDMTCEEMVNEAGSDLVCEQYGEYCCGTCAKLEQENSDRGYEYKLFETGSVSRNACAADKASLIKEEKRHDRIDCEEQCDSDSDCKYYTYMEKNFWCRLTKTCNNHEIADVRRHGDQVYIFAKSNIEDNIGELSVGTSNSLMLNLLLVVFLVLAFYVGYVYGTKTQKQSYVRLLEENEIQLSNL